MNLILKRAAMALMVSFGVVALWAPFHFHRLEGAERQTVGTVLLGYLDDPDSPIPGLADAPRISESEMDGLPALREGLIGALRSLQIPSFFRVDPKEADAFAEKFSGGDLSEYAFVYRSHFFRLHDEAAELRKAISEATQGEHETESLFPVALRCDAPVQVFSPDHPYLEAGGPVPLYESLGAAMEQVDGSARVINGGKLLNVEYGLVYDQAEIPIPILPNGFRILGLTALLGGLIAGRGLYRQALTPGISICSPANAFAADAVFVVFLGLCWVPTTDLLLVWLFDAYPIVSEPQFHFMGVFCGILVTLILAPYITTMSVQRVIVNADGIRVRSTLNDQTIPWNEFNSIETSDFHVPVERVGMLFPRRAAQVLKLKGAAASVTILDPSTRSGKQRIVNAMLQHAPESLRETIREAGRNWQG